jgi:hypothetical protein
MDEQRYYELKHAVGKLEQKVEIQEKTMDSIIEKQEKHETKFEQVFEKLADSVQGIDKKLDVFIAQNTTATNVWDKVVKIAPTLIALLIGGWWTYNQSILSEIKDNQTPQSVYLQPVQPSKK